MNRAHNHFIGTVHYSGGRYRFCYKQLTNIFIIGSTVLSGILFAVIELFPNQILSAFITESDIEMEL